MVKKEKLIIGDYRPFVHEKGVNEMIGCKEGQVFWEVYMGNGTGFDTKRQEDAIIISQLLKIERLLRRRNNGK